jgi:hypothetical protein
MRKLLICATQEIAAKLEEILRHNFDVKLDILGYNAVNVVCEILAEVQRKWVTVCRFSRTESLQDILTMFRINLRLITKKS